MEDVQVYLFACACVCADLRAAGVPVPRKIGQGGVIRTTDTTTKASISVKRGVQTNTWYCIVIARLSSQVPLLLCFCRRSKF